MELLKLFVLFIGVFAGVGGELYTAIADLEELLQTEGVLVRTLSNYIGLQEKRIATLRRKLDEFEKEHVIATKDVGQYLSNPINAYLLVKRLTSDWKNIESLMTDEISKDVMQNMTEFRVFLKFPTDEDLTGAAIALMRLQDTYKMDTSSLARGELNGVQYSSQLSAADCFELGRQSYNNQDFYHTLLWMKEALKRHEREMNQTETERWEILEYLAYSTYMQGNIKSALKITDELLEIVPNHQRALGNKVYYQSALEKEIAAQTGKPEQTESETQETVIPEEQRPFEELSDREKYEMTCRGTLTPDPEIMSKLKCRYTHYNKPFLRLAPLKEEEAYLNPRILLFRQSLSDYEIETVKRLAYPRLKRATVQNYETGALETASYRISKSAWLKDHDDEVITKLSKRVEDMTQMTVDTAEELQVVNYGIGGHYEPHYDFARRGEKNAFKSLGTGNRIATVLFYMTDVAQGGATVFPVLKLALWPEKGTAAYWLNLHRSGDGDFRTRHAACPVLTGSKWVCNKWLHEIGQEFLRPCTLEQPPENLEPNSEEDEEEEI